MEMGTGKSKVCIDNAGILFELGRIDTFVVVAPKGVFRNWARIEIPVHLPDRIEREMGMWSSTPKREQKKQLESFLSPNVAGNLRILVMNVEALSTGKGTRYLEQVLKNSKALFAILLIWW